MFEFFVFLAVASAIIMGLFLFWSIFIVLNIAAHADFEEYPYDEIEDK